MNMFLSKHAGNRICPDCTAHPPNVSGLRRVHFDLDTYMSQKEKDDKFDGRAGL